MARVRGDVRLGARARPRAHRATVSRSPPIWAPATSSTAPIADFAAVYAEQNQRDYDALREAVDAGRVKAEFGV